MGALMLAAVLWTARTTNRMYAAEMGNSSFRSQPATGSQILAGLDQSSELESNQMSTIPVKPPIDATVPAKLQVATFSLG
jgi:hypothetical protein